MFSEPATTIPDDIIALKDDWALSRVISVPDNSTIVVAGAFTGKLLEFCALSYPAKAIYGYEPQKWAADRARERVASYGSKIIVKDYGLGTASVENLKMGEWGTDACSFLTEERETGEGAMHHAIEEFADIINEQEHAIDLAILNMEGYEFVLLPWLLGHEHITSMVRRWAIQFHIKYTTSSHFAWILKELDRLYHYKFNYFLTSWGYWSDTPIN